MCIVHSRVEEGECLLFENNTITVKIWISVIKGAGRIGSRRGRRSNAVYLGLTVMYLLTEREGRTEKYLVRGIRAV